MECHKEIRLYFLMQWQYPFNVLRKMNRYKLLCIERRLSVNITLTCNIYHDEKAALVCVVVIHEDKETEG